MRGCIVAVFAYSLSSIDKTLEKHPELALMDGAEYVTYKQAEMASKKIPFIIETPAVSDPALPSELPRLDAPTDEGEE